MEVEPLVLSFKEINSKAEEFLNQYHPSLSLPIPIEEIIDLQLKIDIIPIPGLKKALQGYSLDIDGFISSDFKSISIDDYVQENFINRYRFTLSHEIAHRQLHRYFYKQFDIQTIDDWKVVVNKLPDWPVKVLEYQADMFAGLILVPRNLLKEEFKKTKIEAEKIAKVYGYGDGLILNLTINFLAQIFQVSEASMGICLNRDQLK